MARIFFSFVFLLIFLLPGADAQPPLPPAHAHNDYEHARPLLDALDRGFCSVEADVFLVGEELFVAHHLPANPDTSHTLKSLYLSPLQERILQNQGKVYPNYPGPFYLMIDIKSRAEDVYPVLKKQLLPFYSLFRQAGVTVFLSGNRPIEAILQDSSRIMALDGRPADLGKGYSPECMPIVSDHYGKHLKWKGEGRMPEKEKATLKELVEKTHAEGKKLRLWASPEKESVWQELLRAGVDFINTDKLNELAAFLLKQSK